MKSAFTRNAAAIFTLVAALFFLAVPSAKATPTNPAPYGTFTYGGYGTIASNTFTYNAGSPTFDTSYNTTRGTYGSATLTLLSPINLGTISTPEELFTMVLGGTTLTFYLTEVDSYTAATVSTKGSFTGLGYFTDSDYPGVDYYGAFSLTNSGVGAGDQNFSAQLTVGTPEPSALVLLGTGLLAMALVAGRKFRVA
ncbi:PEP-CTERM protein-sorting domain-containing protein [Bryocella elongata]|uniref:PEP-CTERM protein-sorting domain-containing protein n=1 Tax=Bryocella elongata TaxID=863522 RepID=A0A1H5SF67_9BACT|nr:PEP-CTERM sorting domain-containing protein [Bryocella elongata]SEF49236.1 PEP-CTERM protein-sorting domain-containing protein [Bryocella elongata]